MSAHRIAFDAIGTKWVIECADDISTRRWQHCVTRLEALVDGFDRAYSRFRDDSMVAQISHQPSSVRLPYKGGALMALYHDLYEATDGRVTPLIGTLMNETGYDAEYSLTPQSQLHSPPQWEEALSLAGNRLTTHQPIVLDLGAAGKGHLVDLISHELTKAGMHRYVINAGGDILQRDPTSGATIGLENPLNPTEVIGTVELHNTSICGSAGNRRAWPGFHHIIDPLTRTSPADIVATWVMAGSTALADGIATALFFVAPEQLGRFDFAYAMLLKNRQFKYSTNLPIQLFGDTQ